MILPLWNTFTVAFCRADSKQERSRCHFSGIFSGEVIVAVLFVFLLLLYDFLTERTDEIDRRREETSSGQAPNGGSASQRPRKGAKSANATVDPGGRDFGEGLSPCREDRSEQTRRCITRAFSITGVGRSGIPERSASFFIPKGALTHHLPIGQAVVAFPLVRPCALRGGCGSCGSLQAMLPRLRSRSSLSARRKRCGVSSACENLPLAALSQRQGRTGLPAPAFSLPQRETEKESRR